MSTQSTQEAKPEPELSVRPAPRFQRSARAVRAAVVLAVVALAGFLVLALNGTLAVPFQRTLVLEGGMGSKADFFTDPEVERILMRHHIEVQITRSGSRDVAVNQLRSYDFAVTSGQPAGDLIHQLREKDDEFVKVSRPFVSPLVFATYRPYAQALEAAGIIRPMKASGDRPLYYDLDMDRLLQVVRDRTRWDDPRFRLDDFGVRNGNEILPATSDPCTSNRGGAYVGLLAFVLNGHQVPTESHARIDSVITSILQRQGMPPADAFTTFIAPEGPAIAPLIVSYEHEYLAHQLDYQKRHGRPDDARVLLYPTPSMMSIPQFIALNPDGERLDEVIHEDPDLRRRVVELGLRPIARGSGRPEPQALLNYLAEQNLPAPSTRTDDTEAQLPRLTVFEDMLNKDAGCEKAVP